MNVSVSVAPKSAWDEITQQATTMQYLETPKNFNPDLVIPPEILAEVMSITNDHIPKITMDIEKSQDPDLQIAAGENKKMIHGQQLNANEWYRDRETVSQSRSVSQSRYPQPQERGRTRTLDAQEFALVSPRSSTKP